jgi:hypothetical protein
MQRRGFLILIGEAIAGTALPLPFAWPFSARAQEAAGAKPAADNQPAQIGQVASVQGTATVARGSADARALRVSDAIFRNDTLATGPVSSLGITFDDQTTFSLSANTRLIINEFVYQEAGRANAATFNVAAGTAAFVASLVAKTGDMKIVTPVATLGIRGTTGIVEVPQSGAAPGGVSEPRIKLYVDADGHLGRIEVFDPQGRRLGILTQSASAFALRRGGGGQLEAVPFQI